MTGRVDTTPVMVIRPTRFAAGMVNQRLSSGPAVIPNPHMTQLLSATISVGPGLPGVGMGNSVITPPGVIRPIPFALSSVNQMLPSGPAVTPYGIEFAVGTG